MNWNEWTESYGPELADIKVRTMERASEVAGKVWSALVSQERIGYGVFKVRSDVGPEYAEWCDCPDPVPHTTGFCILR